MMRLAFWIRWSGRDLRRRWLVVLAIAMTIAIGTGSYAGLSSISEWRRLSNDASYAALRFHDLQVSLTTGSSVDAGALRRAVDAIPSRDAITAMEERLVAPTQVDASTAEKTVITPGRIVGIDVGDGTSVDRLWSKEGRVFTAADATQPVAVVDAAFAQHHGLTIPGRITLPGGVQLETVGAGSSPEYLYLTSEVSGSFGAQSSFAIVYVPLQIAQKVAGLPGRVNDLAIRLAPGADVAAIQAQVRSTLATELAGIGSTVSVRRDNASFRVLYDDIGSDQQIYNIFALILLGAGTFAAFNLASRIIEAQRRELGVGMALGVPPRTLAIRPLMLGVQIAILGVLLGVPFGLWVGRAFLGVFEEALPMPEWRSPFAPAVFGRGAVLGIVLPILAVAIPTLRAVRMPPVRAIQTGFRSARGAGLARLAKRLPLPGSTLARMPMRNLLRAPRRTLLTVLGIAAAVTTAVGVTGMVDSFVTTLDQSAAALVGPNRDRVAVTLRGFTPAKSPLVGALGTADGVSAAEPGLSLPAKVHAGERAVDIVLDVQPAESAIFVPQLTRGAFTPGQPGIVLTEKAAKDLHVAVGDEMVLEHPFRSGATEFRTQSTPVTVTGLVGNPLRVFAYMDASQASVFGLAGATNVVNVTPATGSDINRLKRTLLAVEGVASVERVAAASEALDEALGQYNQILRIIEVVALGLALLIAFNSASIAADERAREYATLFAYGVPLRTVLRNAMTEGGVTGALATAAGVGGGLLVIGYIVNVTTPKVIPELGAVVSISAGTVITGALVGVVAATLAPLLTARKLARMDVPSTLRVVE